MINDLPIPEIKPNERAKLISCVDRIIVAKQRDAEADASALQSEIDRLVYALYDLTSQEIQIVEGAVN
jgi:adenine-specific DNA-methyltransferase